MIEKEFVDMDDLPALIGFPRRVLTRLAGDGKIPVVRVPGMKDMYRPKAVREAIVRAYETGGGLGTVQQQETVADTLEKRSSLDADIARIRGRNMMQAKLNLTSDDVQWLPVKGFEDTHRVSRCGKIKSLSRIVPCKGGGQRRIRERVLKVYVNVHGYGVTKMSNGTSKVMYIHRMVADAFCDKPDADDGRRLVLK